MGQPTQGIHSATAAEHVAALAVVVQRFTERNELSLGLSQPEESSRVAVPLDDDPTFTLLVGRIVDALEAGDEQSDASPDASVTVDGDGNFSFTGASDLPDDLGRRVTTALRAGIESGDVPVSTLSLLDDDEREQLLVGWNQTAAPYPSQCLHELVSARAAETPDRVAVVCGDEQLTFAELDARSNQLAHHLIGLGVVSEQLVAIAVERSAEMLVGLLGIMKAGGVYVPVDPAYPAERVSFMLENSQARVVVTQERLVADLPLDGVNVVCLDRDWPQIATLATDAPGVEVAAAQLAYVIYTSGSTGQPKGVQIPHRALMNFLTTMAHRPGLDAHDVLVAVTTLSFDIAGLELYLPLLQGARLVVATAQTTGDPRALAALLAESGATVMQATPTTWRMLLDSDWRPVGSLKALCGGEPLPVALADRLLDAGVELWNMYGPTETTIWSTCKQVTTRGETLTIGRPIANTTIYILDRHREPAPVGAAGELWIGGHGLARGYRGRDDLTAERFIPDPFDSTPGARIYLTGDLARYRADGEIEFLGRIDNQVKVRGFRIELGEIETVLTRHPQVTEAVVTARGANADAELAAYVIAGEPAPSAKELREHAAASLTPYMVPSTVTFLGAFPLTPNGKVDRKALPEPDRSRAADHDVVEPRTEIERRLKEIWERQLQISPIGVTDDFFELGVSSLVAANLFAAIEHELGSSLPLGAIFRAPSIESLAKLLEGSSGESRWTSLVPIQPAGTQPPIFCVHGGAGTILHLAALARRLGTDQPFYGLQSPGLYGGSTPLQSVEEMAAHYLQEMRQVHPGGPWRLGGYCFGSLVAFEMAKRLTAAGEDVELFMVFNGPSPSWIRRWGWHGNQPSWRERAGKKPIENMGEARKRSRRRKSLMRPFDAATKIVKRGPRALVQPKKIVGYVSWTTRKPRTALALRMGRPIPERLREAYFFGLHGHAEQVYAPEPWDGDAIVFYGAQLYEDPTLGWNDYIRGELETVEVPGRHPGNRQAMMEPAVAFTAAALAERLARLGMTTAGTEG
jgi:amino acid adenylation domain-containing protein